jgi:hypothetical protein
VAGRSAHRRDRGWSRARFLDRRNAGGAQERIQQRAIFQFQARDVFPAPRDVFPRSRQLVFKQAHVTATEGAPRTPKPFANFTVHEVSEET